MTKEITIDQALLNHGNSMIMARMLTLLAGEPSLEFREFDVPGMPFKFRFGKNGMNSIIHVDKSKICKDELIKFMKENYPS